MEILTKYRFFYEFFSNKANIQTFFTLYRGWQEMSSVAEPLRLTVKERVLIHLLDHRPPEKTDRAWVAPVALSQEGVADGASIYLAHVPRALKELEKTGLVSEKLGRVERSERRKKVYTLTPPGILEAQKIRKPLWERKIILRGPNGGEREVMLSEAPQLLEAEIGARYPTLKIISSLSDNVLDIKKLLREEKRYFDFMGRVTKLRHFLGKGKGLDEIMRAYIAAGEVYVRAGDKATEFFNEALKSFTRLGRERSARRIYQLRRMYFRTSKGNFGNREPNRGE